MPGFYFLLGFFSHQIQGNMIESTQLSMLPVLPYAEKKIYKIIRDCSKKLKSSKFFHNDAD